MMISYLFRTGVENNKFPLFSPIHLLMLMSVFMIILLLILGKNKIKNDKQLEKKVSMTLVFLIIIENSLFYGWNLFTHPEPLTEIFPLYTCRLVEVLIIFMLITKKSKYFIMPYFWGILGGISSFILPDIGGYYWPHITYLSFYIGHLAIIVGPLYGIIIYNFKIEKREFFYFLKFSYVFYFFTFAVNILVNGNYAFLMAPPIAAQEAGYVPKLIPHFIAYTTIYTFVSSLFYFIPSLYRKHFKIQS
ncbi:MAG TPA: TIGR02206 family membrane protein [Clostridia bacterium]|nr:TIGR02206 family membrane protein [Clostridia bacterium]